MCVGYQGYFKHSRVEDEALRSIIMRTMGLRCLTKQSTFLRKPLQTSDLTMTDIYGNREFEHLAQKRSSLAMMNVIADRHMRAKRLS